MDECIQYNEFTLADFDSPVTSYAYCILVDMIRELLQLPDMMLHTLLSGSCYVTNARFYTLIHFYVWCSCIKISSIFKSVVFL